MYAMNPLIKIAIQFAIKQGVLVAINQYQQRKEIMLMAEAQENKNMFLIGGGSSNGKSTSLMYLEKPEGVLYLNCEHKSLPFKHKFDERKITNPVHIYEAFKWAEGQDHIHTIIVDSFSYLMEMYETKFIYDAKDTRKEWGNYSAYIKKLFHVYCAGSSKNVIFTGHLTEVYDEATMDTEMKVAVKGATKNLGVESFLTTVVHAIKVPLSKLKGIENALLEITEEDEANGYKHVFLTRPSKEFMGRRIRSPMGMWEKNEIFIDNNAQYVLNRLKEYYEA